MYETYIRAVWTCDRCNRKEEIEARDDESFQYVEADKISALQKAGWLYANEGLICPKCTKKEFAPKRRKKKKTRKK